MQAQHLGRAVNLKKEFLFLLDNSHCYFLLTVYMNNTSPGSVRIAIFASGRGSNAKNILAHFSSNPAVEVGLLLTENPESGVFEFSKDFRVPVLLLSKIQYRSGAYLLQVMESYRIDLIILAGYLKKIPDELIERFPKEILNIHPSLLPAYGGKGMYGKYVHQAVLAAGERQSGISIHFVNSVYDDGEILFQKAIDIDPQWTEKDLQGAIGVLEHTFYPQIIEKLTKKILSQRNFS